MAHDVIMSLPQHLNPQCHIAKESFSFFFIFFSFLLSPSILSLLLLKPFQPNHIVPNLTNMALVGRVRDHQNGGHEDEETEVCSLSFLLILPLSLISPLYSYILHPLY